MNGDYLRIYNRHPGEGRDPDVLMMAMFHGFRPAPE
jgi:hypothetical protein